MNRLKNAREGIVILILGVFLLINSIRIKPNPISYEGWLNIFAQAKFVPIVCSIGILILGTILFSKQLSGADSSAKLEKSEWIRMGIVLALTAAYIIACYYFKFLIPTIIYSIAIMFFLNVKEKKALTILLISAICAVFGLLLLPTLINLQLPMI